MTAECHDCGTLFPVFKEPVCPDCDCKVLHKHLGTRWYWQSCFPGCLPDSEPCGPFDTEAEALADAREGME